MIFARLSTLLFYFCCLVETVLAIQDIVIDPVRWLHYIIVHVYVYGCICKRHKTVIFLWLIEGVFTAGVLMDITV